MRRRGGPAGDLALFSGIRATGPSELRRLHATVGEYSEPEVEPALLRATTDGFYGPAMSCVNVSPAFATESPLVSSHSKTYQFDVYFARFGMSSAPA
jgi:hypothetical protein